MKKITLVFFIAVLSSFNALAQFNFTPIAGPTNVAEGAPVTINMNDLANGLPVPADTYIDFTITVDWADDVNAYSNESSLDVVTTAGTVTAAIAGAAGSGASTMLTFTGSFTAPYDPSVDGFFDIILSQSWTGSSANWSNITVSITPAPACPDPTVLIANNFVGPDMGDMSWTAAAGATGYNWEIQPQGIAQGTAGALDSGTTAGVMVTASNLVDVTDYTLYVQSDCGGGNLGFYQSLDFSFNLPPVNNDCATPVVLTAGGVFATNSVVGTNVGATDSGELATTCSSYGGGDVWYSIIVPADGNIDIETNNNGSSMTDTGMEVYSGSCGSLVSVECDDDDSADGFFSLISLTGRTPGEVLLIRVWEYGGDTEDTFQVSAFNASLSIEDLRFTEGFTMFPNPVENKLTVSAKNEIKELSVVNILGQTIKTVTPNNRDYQLDISNLTSGIYFVKARVNNSEGTFRIVKK